MVKVSTLRFAPAATATAPELSFSEDMHGAIRTTGGAEQALSFHVAIATSDLARFTGAGPHAAPARGTVNWPAQGGEVPITGGNFQLFSINPATGQREMRYDLAFTGKDGTRYILHGTKFVHDDPGFDAWRDLTTLYTTVVRAPELPQEPGQTRASPTVIHHHGRSERADIGAAVGNGTLRLNAFDLAKQLTTLRSSKGAAGLATFLGFFAGNVVDTYVKPKWDALRRLL